MSPVHSCVGAPPPPLAIHLATKTGFYRLASHDHRDQRVGELMGGCSHHFKLAVPLPVFVEYIIGL